MYNPQDSSSDPVDASKARRPGVPAERVPQVVGHAHWLVPEKQHARHEVLKDTQRDSLTATFGTGQPPRALSGVLRRVAYTIPDYRAKRWALLLLADRVDSLEGRAATVAKHPATWILGAAAIGLLAASRMRPRKRFGWF